MPRDSGGNYSLPAGNPVVPGATIASTWANTTLQDIALALTNSLSVDGSVTSAKLANNAVSTDKLQDDAVTPPKMNGVAGNGILAASGAAFTTRTITSNTAALTVADGSGASGNPTLDLSDELKGLAALSATGLAVRSATGTYVSRTITGTANKVTVTNGDGVLGNPTLTLPDAITLVSPTITTTLTLGAGSAINGNMTLNGDAVINGSLAATGGAVITGDVDATGNFETTGGHFIGDKLTNGAGQRMSAAAWVSFTSTGAIVDSYNVSSVTKNATGDYTINFSAGVVNPTVVGIAGTSGSGPRFIYINSVSSSSVNVICASVQNPGTKADSTFQHVVIFGD